MLYAIICLDKPRALLIYQGDLAGAEAWAAADPYAAAGLFQSVEIRPWKKVVG